MRWTTAALVTLISALLYGLCFLSPSLQWLAWGAQVPFLIALRRSSARTALFLGWVFAVSVAYVTGDWFSRAVSNYYSQPHIVGLGFFFAVSSIMAAPYVMAFSVAYQSLSRRFNLLLPLLAAAAWVAGELGRNKMLTGCPWAIFGYSQAGISILTQVADLTGVYGVSFVLVAVNAALAELWLQRVVPRPRCWAALGVAGAALLLVVAYGAVRLHPSLATFPPTPIAIVQANLDLGSQWRSQFYGRNLAAYTRLTEDALVSSQPRLLFWPESAMTFFLDQEPLYRQSIGRVLGSHNVQLIAGGPRAAAASGASDGTHYFNSTMLLAPSGEILARYDKQNLLPFAEYFPLPSLDFLNRSFGRVREFTAGEPTPPLPTAAGRAGVIVCNEAMFPEPAAARVDDGAEFLVNPSNDAWLGDVKFSEQVFSMVRFRAIEQRRYLVRASTAGPSAVIEPDGTVQVRTAAFTKAWIQGEISVSHERTLYSRVGDLFAVLCVVAAGLGVLRERMS